LSEWLQTIIVQYNWSQQQQTMAHQVAINHHYYIIEILDDNNMQMLVYDSCILWKILWFGNE
jgi:hypothetical protein